MSVKNTLLSLINRFVVFYRRFTARLRVKRIVWLSLISLQFIIFFFIWSNSYSASNKNITIPADEDVTNIENIKSNPHLLDPDYQYFKDIDTEDSDDSSSSSSSSSGSEFLSIFESTLSNSFLDFINNLYSTTKDSSRNNIAKLYAKLRYNTKPFWFDDYTLQKNLLSISTGPNKGEKWKAIKDIKFYNSDPRLSWTVYMNHILNHTPQNSHNSNNNALMKIPFSWYDWTDMRNVNKLISLQDFRPTCDFLFDGAFQKESLMAIEAELNEPLFESQRDKYENDVWYTYSRQFVDNGVLSNLDKYCKYLEKKPERFSTGLNITQRDDHCRIEVFQIQIRNYMLTTLRSPISLTMLGNNNNTYQFFIDPSNRNNMIESNMLQEYVNSKVDMTEKKILTDENEINFLEIPDIKFDHYKKINEFLENTSISDKFKLVIEGADRDIINKDEVILTVDDFMFDIDAKIEELESLPKEKLTPHNAKYLESLKISNTYNPQLGPKYFKESAKLQEYDGTGYHRDGFFFNGDSSLDDSQEYANRMNSMIRTFQKFTLSNGIITWLSHGTLYGYMYNGATFPWDDDFDLQMPIKHLHYLAQYFNQSIIFEDPREGNGRYILDVSSSISVREKGNGANNIDARFIDIDSGIYIDLTGLSVTSSVARDKVEGYLKDKAKALNIDLENFKLDVPDDEVPNDYEHVGKMNIIQLYKFVADNGDKFSRDQINKVREAYEKETKELSGSRSIEKKLSPAQRFEFHKVAQVFNCRNNHFSPLEHLSPMRNRMFHGVPALIPRKYVIPLRNEYGVPDQYGYIRYKDYTYLPGVMQWMKTNFVDKCANINSWFRGMRPLQFTEKIENMEFKDYKTFLSNIPKYEVDDMTTFGSLYTSFDISAYRMKEIALEYDTKMNQTEKEILLKKLRKDISPRLSSPGKDAMLYAYEKRAYKDLIQNYDPAEIKLIQKKVDEKYIEIYWDKLRALKNNTLEMFQVHSSPSFDFNSYGRKDLFPNNSRNCVKLFKKDPF